MHQKLTGYILAQKNQTSISHAVEQSQVWSQIWLNFMTAP